MLPNFTIVICGAVLTVMMLAVTGSGLVTPETRTRIGEMPEVGRPMMQRMISEPAGQAQFAALELSRRAEEIGRLSGLVTPALVTERGDGEPVPEPAKEPAPASAAADREPAVIEAPAVAAVPMPVPEAVVAEAVPAPPAALPAQDSGKAIAAPVPANRGDPAADAVEATIPGPETSGSQAVAALANTEEVVPSVHLGARLNVRLPRARTVARAATLARKPVHHAVQRPHRHLHRSYAFHGGASNPFGQPRMLYR
jgi:hypothetical protein